MPRCGMRVSQPGRQLEQVACIVRNVRCTPLLHSLCRLPADASFVCCAVLPQFCCPGQGTGRHPSQRVEGVSQRWPDCCLHVARADRRGQGHVFDTPAAAVAAVAASSRHRQQQQHCCGSRLPFRTELRVTNQPANLACSRSDSVLRAAMEVATSSGPGSLQRCPGLRP